MTGAAGQRTRDLQLYGPLLQGTQVYQVLVPERLAPLRVGALDEVEPVRIQDTVYQAWERRDIDVGQGVALELLELPEPSLPDRFGRAITSAALWQVMLPSVWGAFLAVLLLIGVYKGRVELQPSLGTAGVLGDDIDPGRNQMVQEIADLDDRFEKGELIDQEYRERRQALKIRILETPEHSPGQSPIEP